MQCLVDTVYQTVIDQHAIREPNLHLLRMHIDIHNFRIDINPEHRKRKFMLHQEIPAAILNRFGNHRIFYIPGIDKVNLKVPVAPVDLRLPHKAPDGHRRNPGKGGPLICLIDRDQLVRDIPTVNRVNDIHEGAVTERGKTLPAILEVTEAHFRMCQSFHLHNILDPGGLRLRGFQKLPSGRHIFKKVPDDDRCTIRRPDVRQLLLHTTVYHIVRGIERPGLLGNHFHLGNCRNGGKCLTPEAKRLNASKVARIPDLGGCVPYKCIAHILSCNPDPVIRNPDHGNAALPDFYGN